MGRDMTEEELVARWGGRERDPGQDPLLKGMFVRCEWCGAAEGFAPTEQTCVTCGTPRGKEPLGRGKGEYVIGLVGLVHEGLPPTGLEGKFLVEYDPRRQGYTPDGRPLMAHITASDELAEALRFEDVVSARAEWMRWDGTFRFDGSPSRPLTAFSIQTEKAIRKE